MPRIYFCWYVVGHSKISIDLQLPSCILDKPAWLYRQLLHIHVSQFLPVETAIPVSTGIFGDPTESHDYQTRLLHHVKDWLTLTSYISFTLSSDVGWNVPILKKMNGLPFLKF